MRRSWSLLGSLGLEFWLALPIVGLLFWASSGWISAQQIRSKVNKPESIQFNVLPINVLPKKQYAGRITAITIKMEARSSTVIVNTTSPILQTFTLEFPTTDHAQAEKATAQVLGLSTDEVQALSQPAD